MLYTQKPIAITKEILFPKMRPIGTSKPDTVDSIIIIHANNRACKTKCLDIRHRPIS